MNRLSDIQLTLPRNLETVAHLEGVEIVLLDYSSSDGLVDWLLANCRTQLDSGLLKVFRFSGKEYFHHAHAKNLAHRQAQGLVVCNIDADNFIAPGFAEYIIHTYAKDPDVLGIAWKWSIDSPESYKDLPKGLGGRIFLSRKHFNELGGYDERMYGYGAEDKDLIDRAMSKGLHREFIPRELLETIPTDDEKRCRYLPPPETPTDPAALWRLQLRANEIIMKENSAQGVLRVNSEGWGKGQLERII